MSLNVVVKQQGNGSYNVFFSFLGHKWQLQNFGSQQTWMIKHEDATVQTPLRHFKDSARRMTLADDSVTAAITQAKFQILRLKYNKLTPTFHEQHINYFAPTSGVEAVD